MKRDSRMKMEVRGDSCKARTMKRMVKMVKVHPGYSMTKRAGAWFGNKLIPLGLMRSNLSTALT